jgi:hypothetical protein
MNVSSNAEAVGSSCAMLHAGLSARVSLTCSLAASTADYRPGPALPRFIFFLGSRLSRSLASFDAAEHQNDAMSKRARLQVEEALTSDATGRVICPGTSLYIRDDTSR